MILEILTPDKKVFKGEVQMVQFPGIDGSFGVLNNHAPLISILKAGKIKLLDMDNQTQFIEVNGGVVEVLKNKILVLAE
jgi:F-type H+-transporting ATPase subunit epsilon